MTYFSTKLKLDELVLIANTEGIELFINDLQVRLPVVLEYQYIKNISYLEDKDLNKNIGDFTRDMCTIVPKEDGSTIITIKDIVVCDDIFAYINTREIDFVVTKLSYKLAAKVADDYNDNSDYKEYALQYDEKHLSSRLTKEAFFEALQSPKADIPNNLLEYIVNLPNEYLDSWSAITYATILEEDCNYFNPY